MLNSASFGSLLISLILFSGSSGTLHGASFGSSLHRFLFFYASLLGVILGLITCREYDNHDYKLYLLLVTNRKDIVTWEVKFVGKQTLDAV